ncbi:MAG: ATP-binding protein [Lachnospiraceae bacterium]|nr:ATP-binding protein [Lachnospiraceae bacterium]
MSSKEKILEAWIMCERLSEGSINLRDKKIRAFKELLNNNYYDLFRSLIDEEIKRRHSSPKNVGIVVYLNIFGASEIADILRDKYQLQRTNEETDMGIKFGLAVCFDYHLHLNNNLTFITGSEYIRRKRRVPDEKSFNEYEESLKLELEQMFDLCDIPIEEQKEYFNAAMLKLMQKVGASPDKCRLEFMKNLEDDSSNLHSFFIDDLEKAKRINTPNLNAYLFGYDGYRTNLDSKKSSQNFNTEVFEDILSPIIYPLGRFPSNTKFSLSFMQQVAVNLATGYDHRTIRSVNGPPGSGKTTLLKDIFAELIVKQSYELANLGEHTIRGGEATKYYNKSSIGELPDNIAENNIVVASSNNGAVKNIVDELPLISKIDGDLLIGLKEADYFYELSNRTFSNSWEKAENGKFTEKCISEKSSEPEKNWGLFSMEGGRSENMNSIRSAILHIYEYLNNEYIPDTSIYKQFLKEYREVESFREKGSRFEEKCKAIKSCQAEYEKKSTVYPKERDIKESSSKKIISELEGTIATYNAKQNLIKTQLNDVKSKRKDIQNYKEQFGAVIESIKAQKPNLLAGRKQKQEYREMVIDANQKLLTSIDDDKKLADTERDLRQKLDSIVTDIAEVQIRIDTEKAEFTAWVSQKEHELTELKATIDELQREISSYQAAPLDMSVGYDELQKSSPWFGQDYRIAQSKLFITALRARKQFLFDNKNNIRAAFVIWKNQKKYLENKRLIKAAWNWINFAIPVISSTFASFGRMCKNLDENTIGHLFIDEAGQALPCAAVGAVFRSRHVMMVGDPSQIPPVQTLDSNIMAMLSKHFGVDEKHLSNDASAQTLADSASRYGYYFDKNRTESSWIGIPLWVHRRCDYPMFTIANQISYFNMMVQSEEKYGKTGWFNIKGKANNKYVKEQGDFLANKLEKMIKDNPDIIDKDKPDKVYIITPFRNVALMLTQRLDKIGFTRYDEKKKATNIGTIHTFQGKEASIVFMVMGADENSKGAANWAVSEPNMMNVAATRAKNEFYIIGDKELYKDLHSEVADNTIGIINKYQIEHPELVDEDTSFTELSSATALTLKNKQADTPVSDDDNTPPAIKGEVIYVGCGTHNNYAYIKGSDGKKYTVNEKMYAKITNATELIIKGNTVCFTPCFSNNTFYAKNITKG